MQIHSYRLKGNLTPSKSINERYGVIGHDDLIRAIDSMKFDTGETEMWVKK
jgi:hypothetical protein